MPEASVRRKLALAALALPILAMIGLFAWAGGESTTSPVTVVRSFVTAFNNGDCKVMASELYRAPGAKAPTCKQLIGSGTTKLRSCGLQQESIGSSTSTASDKAPAGYGDAAIVRATCSEDAAAKKEAVVFNFLVATNDTSGQQEILSLQLAGA